jgi:predicted nucleotidyltransferase
MSVGDWFRTFHNNVYMDSSTVDTVARRYRTITRKVNSEYWFSESETNNSLYVGSYGRATEIYTSDIDIIVSLPWSVKERFDKRIGNIQSQLLTEIKDKLSQTYPSSDLSSDGQVIVISFSDGIRYEIVPAFKYSDGRFCYPDTHNDGSWKVMNPKEEMNSFNLRHRVHNYTMKKFCRMIRSWREANNITISGELIDSIVYDFYSNNSYTNKDPFIYFDWLTRDFFKYLSVNTHKKWYTPGTYRTLEIKYPHITEDKAEEAYNKSLEAIKDEVQYPNLAKKTWREIYGNKFSRR